MRNEKTGFLPSTCTYSLGHKSLVLLQLPPALPLHSGLLAPPSGQRLERKGTKKDLTHTFIKPQVLGSGFPRPSGRMTEFYGEILFHVPAALFNTGASFGSKLGDKREKKSGRLIQ